MGLTQVSTKGIKDATLLNEDVNASAAIAMSKLALSITNSEINASAAIAKSKIENLINNNADNRLITGSGTANTLNGEANATFTGTKLNLGPYDGGTDVNLSLRNTNSGGYGAYISGGSGTNYILRLDDKDQNAMFRFNANGKLGIGTGTPTGQIHLYQASNDPYIYIQRGSGDTTATIGGIFWKNSTNNLGLIDVQSADINDGRMRFYVNKNGTLTESLKIDENGNLEVLDASEARLQVKTPSNGIIALRADGTNTQLGTWSNHDMHIIRNNSIQATVNDTGIAFPSGKGIDFSETSNASGMSSELLDDYEEGTWSPTLHTQGGASNATISAAGGFYTKVGRLVHVTFHMNWNGATNHSGYVYFNNLPFTSQASSSGYYQNGVGAVMTHGMPFAGTAPVLLMGGNSTGTNLYFSSNNSGWIPGNNSNTGQIIASLTYNAA